MGCATAERDSRETTAERGYDPRVTAFRFVGRERATIELDGSFDPAALAVPPCLALELDGAGRARVRLFAFHVVGLRVVGLPFVRASYAELLWRVAVRADRERAPAWWVVACDLGARGPRLAAARYVRYPVRDQAVEVEAARVVSSGAAGRLAIALGPPGAPGLAHEPRAVVVGARAEYEVPWGDDGAAAKPAPATIEADSLAVATLGAPVAWAATAAIRVDREHRCGVARQR